jgi:serine/threonine protein phosphatase PrpC
MKFLSGTTRNNNSTRSAPALFTAGVTAVGASLMFSEDKKIRAAPPQSRIEAGHRLYSSTHTSTSNCTSSRTPPDGATCTTLNSRFMNNYASHLNLPAASSRFNPDIHATPSLLRRTRRLDVVSHVSDPMLLALPAAVLACSCFMMPSMMPRAAASTRHRLLGSPTSTNMFLSPLFLALAAVAAAKTPVTEAADAAIPKPSYCPTYGCPMTPQDILNGPVQEALREIRDSSKSGLRSRETKQVVLQQLQSSGDEQKATLTLTGYKGGSKSEQVNQDRAFVISPFLTSKESQKDDLEAHRLMGVFDGHATSGEKVAEYCTQQLPKMLAARLSKRLTKNITEDEQDRIVLSTLEEIYLELDKTAPYGESSGTTASVVLQMGKKLYLASTGDSPSFVCVHQAHSNTTDVIYVTPDHKPDLPEERARIEGMGGRVWVPPSRGADARVLFTDPETGEEAGIAMSRSIGDRDVGKYGVIANPAMQVIDLEELIHDRMTEAHEKCSNTTGRKMTKFLMGDHAEQDAPIDDVHIFVVSASDGMMDVLNAKGIARFLVPSLCEDSGIHLLTACEKLISTAAEGWRRASEDGSYRDDIAISVSKIRTPPSSTKQE